MNINLLIIIEQKFVYLQDSFLIDLMISKELA